MVALKLLRHRDIPENGNSAKSCSRLGGSADHLGLSNIANIGRAAAILVYAVSAKMGNIGKTPRNIDFG